MREKLIDLIIQADDDALRKREQEKAESNRDLYGFVADYLLDNGVVVLRCKVGDKVYVIRYGEETDYIIVPMLILEVKQNVNGVFFEPSDNIPAFRPKDFGKWVFTTKEEAEAKLAEINNRDAINTEVNYSDAMNVYRELNTHDREKSVSELAELKGTEE